MVDIIIIAVLVLMIGYGVYKIVKKAVKRETCCGTTIVKINKKKLKKPIGKYVLRIEGMHCNNCKKRIMDGINAMDKIAIDIDLMVREGVVTYEEDIDINVVIDKIEAMGYECELLK